MTDSLIEYRDITDLKGCRDVVGIEVAVWGADSETIPASLLSVSVKRGGILIGAYQRESLVGFVWSMPAQRDGQLTHWSHMLGVLPPARGGGVGRQLKLEQRQRARQHGIELIEWTFDPLQAPNAHLNFVLLGCTASHYVVDAYGAMSGPLHRGTPTDRLIAEWWIGSPHVERRIGGRGELVARSSDVSVAPSLIETRREGPWVACGDLKPVEAPRVVIPIPPAFGDMQQRETTLALAWRLRAREAFTWAFDRGYRAVDFFLNRDEGGGAYLLAQF